jgi:CheY-like chemotaxis protein
VIDFAMPQMNGVAVVGAIRQRRPDLPVLLITGYVAAEAGESLAALPTLRKPFKPAELVAGVAGLLGSPADGAEVLPLRPRRTE